VARSSAPSVTTQLSFVAQVVAAVVTGAIVSAVSGGGAGMLGGADVGAGEDDGVSEDVDGDGEGDGVGVVGREEDGARDDGSVAGADGELSAVLGRGVGDPTVLC
jgi:hypothetical protein